MRDFFYPKSVAVIGVSPRENNLARQIVRNLVEFDFQGIYYLVGPKGGVQFGRRIYRSVVDIPDRIDLAVILTPAATVPAIMEELGEKGVKRAIIETAGFTEKGEDGAAIAAEVIRVAKKNDIRFIGPNCIGVINRHNGLAVPFTYMKNVYRKGGVTIISQSGGVGISYLNELASESIGLNCFASVGNKMNVDENDLLEHFIEEENTEIICMYLEAISDGKRLMDIARRSKKPILLHKSNTGELGKRIAASHTASLSGDDDITDAALKQCGIARFYEPEQLVNYLKALPLPSIKGNRLGVISRSGGHAVIAADECEQQGFSLAPFDEQFIKEIESNFRASVIKLSNPLDLGDLFDMEVYDNIITRTLKEPNVDGVVFLHTYLSQTEGDASRQLINGVMHKAKEIGKPLTVYVATDHSEIAALKHDLEFPVFTDVEDAIRSIAMVRDFRERESMVETPPTIEMELDHERARAIIDSCKEKDRDPLLDEALEIFEAYGLPTLPSGYAQTEDEAVELAEKHGYPVVLKIIAPEVSHKSDLGGVQINLKSERGVRKAWNEMYDSILRSVPNAHIEGMMVQPMAKGGAEMILGGKKDRLFGPALMVGIGGVYVEVFRNVSIRVVPFSRDEACQMVDDLVISPILRGVRGQTPYDVNAFVDCIMRASRLMLDFPEILEFDANPIRVRPDGKGCVALDARIVLERT